MELHILESTPVYLMPINVISLSLCVILQGKNFDVRGIWDNNEKAHGKTFRGVKISGPESEIEEASIVVVCSDRSAKGINNQLMNLGLKTVDAIEKILSFEDAELLIREFQLIKTEELKSIAPFYSELHNVADMRIRKSLSSQSSKLSTDANIINNFNLMITEKCSLRCNSCSAFMQYFERPVEYSSEDVINGFNLFIEKVDFIKEVTLIGGEPFLHKGIADIAKTISENEKVAMISIITNGTVIPNDMICEALADIEQLYITISDYGSLSTKKDELIRKLERYNISYYLMNDMIWYDRPVIVDAESRLQQEVQKTYENCNINCAAIAGDRFSKCQVALSLGLLKAIPPEREEVCKSILRIDSDTDRDAIHDHLNSSMAMGACYVCSGKSRVHSRQIPPAIQAKQTLIYRKYEDNERV